MLRRTEIRAAPGFRIAHSTGHLGAVQETDVHYPTDSSLLREGVRVLSRLLRRAKRALGEEAAQAASLPKQVLRTRMPSVRRTVQQIPGTARRRGEGVNRAGFSGGLRT